MTGFSQTKIELGFNTYFIEIKSVNHRFLDCRFRLPTSLFIFESLFVKTIREYFERGSFEILIRHKVSSQSKEAFRNTRFLLDLEAAESLVKNCAILRKKKLLSGKLTPEFFSQKEGVFIPIQEELDSTEIYEAIHPAFAQALKDLKEMRKTEGNNLKKVLSQLIQELTQSIMQIEQEAKNIPNEIAEKLKNKIQSWIQEGKVTQVLDSNRLEWEIAYFADRSDLTEEIHRLQSHLQEFSTLLTQKISLGRKLDFLIQEMHREVNTLSTKTSSMAITKLALGAKSLIERLREQVQNVE